MYLGLNLPSTSGLIGASRLANRSGSVRRHQSISVPSLITSSRLTGVHNMLVSTAATMPSAIAIHMGPLVASSRLGYKPRATTATVIARLRLVSAPDPRADALQRLGARAARVYSDVHVG